jgi:hypothetical protein
MNDHLFDKKHFLRNKKEAKEQQERPFEMCFEQEIIQYLRNGLQGRAKEFARCAKRVPHIDMIFNFTPISEMDKYGEHICGYYQKVHLNKKRLYEEFG